MANCFDKGVKVIQWRKNSLSTNGNGTIEHICQKNELLKPQTLYKSQLKMDHRSKFDKHLDKNIKEYIHELGWRSSLKLILKKYNK